MLRVYLMTVAAFVLTASSVLADAPKKGEEPSIFTPPRFDLTLWSIVIFVLLFLVLRKWAWGPILDGLKKRESTIEAAIEEARHAREAMAKQQAAFQQQLNEANQQIPRLMEEARRDADRLKEEMRAAANADIQTERQRLHREIDMARDQALQEIWNQAANLATVISAQAIKRSLTPDDHRRLVDDALREVEDIASQGKGRAGEVGLEWVRQAGGKL